MWTLKDFEINLVANFANFYFSVRYADAVFVIAIDIPFSMGRKLYGVGLKFKG